MVEFIEELNVEEMMGTEGGACNNSFELYTMQTANIRRK